MKKSLKNSLIIYTVDLKFANLFLILLPEYLNGNLILAFLIFCPILCPTFAFTEKAKNTTLFEKKSVIDQLTQPNIGGVQCIPLIGDRQ